MATQLAYNKMKNQLAALRKEVTCAICLGIIRRTKMIQDCFHRFCRHCIEEAMQKGKKECPICRQEFASRRSLKDDPGYDTVIAIMFGDITEYEADEARLNEEEMALKKKTNEQVVLKRKKRPITSSVVGESSMTIEVGKDCPSLELFVELDFAKMTIVIFSLEEELSNIEKVFMTVSPSSSAAELRENMSLLMELPKDKIDLYVVKRLHKIGDDPNARDSDMLYDSSRDELRLLDDKETIGSLMWHAINGNVVIGYDTI
ncbi:hypothetical protein ACFE04_002089 [Oxalis oulophora]